MLRSAAISIVAILAGAAGAQAADLVGGAPMPSGYDWSGFNAGVFGGWGSGDGQYANIDNEVVYSGPVDGSLYGARIGLRHQFDAFVLGASVSGAIANIDGSGTDGVDSAEFNVEWTSAADLQLGVAYERLMLYGMFGLAAASIQHDYKSGTNSGDVSYDSETHTGYSFGGGVEYAFSDMVTGWAEARKYNLGSEEFGQVTNVISHDLEVDFSTVTVGVGLKF